MLQLGEEIQFAALQRKTAIFLLELLKYRYSVPVPLLT